ncbi:MAG: hypothetical protein AB7E47_00780 [Desulfovibrionaceae bacterium]
MSTLRIICLFLSMVLATAILAGCSGKMHAISLSEAKSSCRMYSPGGGSSSDLPDSPCTPGDQETICTDMSTAVGDASTLSACLAACEATRQKQIQGYTLLGCDNVIFNGYLLCQQYCRGTFAE